MRFFRYTLISLVASFGLLACSDDSSSEENSVVAANEGVPGGNAPGEEIVHQENISVDSVALSLSGVAEVGPFLAGGSVLVVELNPETFSLSENSLKASISSNTGSFTLAGPFHSAYASVTASGAFYSYQRLDSTMTVTLRALSEVNDRKNLNVNVLTELEYDRVKKLIGEGMTFMDAKRTAEKEIRAAFNLLPDTTLFENASLYGSGASAVNLLTVTTILLGERSEEEFKMYMASMAADLADNGKWDDDSLRAILADEAYGSSVDYIAFNIADRNKVDAVEVFGPTVMNFWANVYGIGACDESTSGTMLQNTNKLSINYEKYFRCLGGEWLVVSQAVLLSLEKSKEFGECTDDKENVMKTDAANDTYICKKGYWRLATASELANKVVAEAKGECSADKYSSVESLDSKYYICVSNVWKPIEKKPVDYSKGRKMNERLGCGINLGNAWESSGNGASADCGWNNCIEDGYFKIVKDAGFNSVRIPVRWNADAMRSEPYTLDAGRLAGVKADVSLAIAQGLAVIINIHHYSEMLSAAGNYKKNPDNYKKEKARMVAMWSQIAKEFNSFPDSLLVYEIFNEPRDMDIAQLNDFMLASYKVMRENAPGKTIMFESNGYSKFAQIKNLELPEDGNIIVSGHYYEPYTVTHQGHGYDCSNSLGSWDKSSVKAHFREYVDSTAVHFPDINGGYVPMNMGEFGVSGQHGSSCGGNGVSDALRAEWTDAIIAEAEKYHMSWQYWGFVGVGGFEAYDKNGGKWYPELLQVFSKYLGK